MIKRKPKRGKKYNFWTHYHTIVEMCYEGNEELLAKLNSYDVKAESERLYTIANIPEKYFEFEFDDIKDVILSNRSNQKSVKTIEKYLGSVGSAADQGIGMYLNGNHGTAKTTISIIILKIAISQFYRCFFWKSSDIVSFIKSSWKNEFRRRFFDYIIETVDFLVIDDIARLFEFDAKKEEQMYVDQIFARRDDMNKSTILTGNLDFDTDESKNSFGSALLSNFRERLIKVKLYGKDFRETIGKSLEDRL